MTSTDSYELACELNGISHILSVLRTSLEPGGYTPRLETIQYTLDGITTHLDRIVKELDA